MSDDIIKNITFLLDNLLENYKLQDGNRKKCILNQSGVTNPEYYEDQKLKPSFIHLRKSPPFNVKTYKPIMTGDYKFSSVLADSKDQDLKDKPQVNNNNLLLEIKKLLPSEMFNLLRIRNRRSTNEKLSQKKFKVYNNKLFQDEISALYNIVENIKNKLVFKKVMDYVGEEDNLINEFKSFQKVGSTSVIPLVDNTSNKNKNDLRDIKYSQDANDAKVDEILETIENIGKELEQIDSKEKFLQGILDLETKNHMNRNKKKINRNKNNIAVSSPKLSKAVYVKPSKHKKIKKNSKKTEIKKKKHKHTSLPPCCKTTFVDEGNHVSIEWCCPNEEIKTGFVESISSTALSTESNTTSTSVQKTKKPKEESTTSSTQNTKEAEQDISEEINSSTRTTSLVTKSIISSIHTTKEASTSTSSTQTTKNEVSVTHSTIQTTTKSLTKRNHDHGHKKKHSRFKENLLSGKYIPQSVEESFQ